MRAVVLKSIVYLYRISARRQVARGPPLPPSPSAPPYSALPYIHRPAELRLVTSIALSIPIGIELPLAHPSPSSPMRPCPPPPESRPLLPARACSPARRTPSVLELLHGGLSTLIETVLGHAEGYKIDRLPQSIGLRTATDWRSAPVRHKDYSVQPANTVNPFMDLERPLQARPL